EGFAPDDAALLGHVLEERGLEEGAVALATAEHSGPRLDRLLDPALQATSLRLGDHRPDEGVFGLGVAHHERPSLGDEAFPEVLVDATVGVDALHGDAALARLVEGSGDEAPDGVLQVRVFVDDAGGVAAELEHHLFLAG